MIILLKIILFADAFVAIDGSKFQAVNNRNRSFTLGKVKARLKQIDESIDRYLKQIASADRIDTPESKAIQERLQRI